jgi:hypothetical protein
MRTKYRARHQRKANTVTITKEQDGVKVGSCAHRKCHKCTIVETECTSDNCVRQPTKTDVKLTHVVKYNGLVDKWLCQRCV